MLLIPFMTTLSLGLVSGAPGGVSSSILFHTRPCPGQAPPASAGVGSSIPQVTFPRFPGSSAGMPLDFVGLPSTSFQLGLHNPLSVCFVWGIASTVSWITSLLHDWSSVAFLCWHALLSFHAFSSSQECPAQGVASAMITDIR